MYFETTSDDEHAHAQDRLTSHIKAFANNTE
jgi:hypothetical protein